MMNHAAETGDKDEHHQKTDNQDTDAVNVQGIFHALTQISQIILMTNYPVFYHL